MNWMFIIVAVFVGALVPFQGALNAKLSAELAHPLLAVCISFLVGFIACVVLLQIIQGDWVGIKTLWAIDKYLYFGGVLGVIFVTGMVFLMPKIGIATMLTATIVGQLLVSLVLDHYGAFGGLEIKVTLSKAIGACLLIAGLYFIQR